MKIELEEMLLSRVSTDEVGTSETNKVDETAEFESFLALLDAERDEKDYDWMSDIRINEFASQALTQSSIDVDQYFKTRDFVEVYVEDEGDRAIAAAKAARELINRTLNRRDLYHYLKYVRAKGLTNLAGRCYAVAQWKKRTVKKVTGQREEYEILDVDEFGDKITSEDQVPAIRPKLVDVVEDVAVVDKFDYDIFDQRNVFTDNTYAYSPQQKSFITLRTEKTMQELKASADEMGYTGLDELDKESHQETETSKSTYNKDQSHEKVKSPQSKTYDLYTRYGKYWAVVTSRGVDDEPVTATPGWDEEGNQVAGAEFIQMIISWVQSGAEKKVIRFQPTPYIDDSGSAYMPVLRGLCYVHLVEDGGVGDGLYSRDLQTAIDDTFNASNDRSMLATFPTMKGKKYALEDNSTVYFEPMHTIELENPDDLQEFRISDNTQGALQQMSVLTSKMQQLTAITPPTMGGQVAASTTATAIAGAEQHTNIRTNYKSMTFDNTFMSDLYWMIQQMTYRFAEEETAMKLLGDKVYDFDPSLEYFYKPLSQSIESEQSKFAKIDKWNTSLGYIAQIPNPKTVSLANKIITNIFELMGDEYANFGKALLDESVPMETGGVNVERGAGSQAATNQSGLPQGGLEQMVRGNNA